MNLLLLYLPPGAPGNYPYATSVDGQHILDHGQTVADVLPPTERGVEVVAIVPAALLSWHQVTLPVGVGPNSPRLRAVLTGLLEDHLLDDPAQLHFALEPGAAAASTVWVAACDKAWLSVHLQTLDAAQCAVSRIVPEIHPRVGHLQLILTGEPERMWLLMSGQTVPGQVQALPLNASALALLRSATVASADAEPVELMAEPAMAASAERMLDRHVTIQPAADRWLNASRTHWDLAQLDFARTGTARMAKRLHTFGRDFWHAPTWKPARWGVLLLLLINLIGLNVWAWRSQRDLTERRNQIQALLTHTFPQVKVIVDAPVQMSRQVMLLRQSTGAATAADFEPMLTAIGTSIPAYTLPTAIEFSPGQLHLSGVELAADALNQTNQSLKPLGYLLRADDSGLILGAENLS